jgi:hypothetical protein
MDGSKYLTTEEVIERYRGVVSAGELFARGRPSSKLGRQSSIQLKSSTRGRKETKSPAGQLEGCLCSILIRREDHNFSRPAVLPSPAERRLVKSPIKQSTW